MTPDEAITVIIPTSPVPGHPSTAIIEETLATIRVHLPTADVLIGCDGVREEQEDRRADYTEYLRRLVWLCANEWERVTPVLEDGHVHQSGLLRRLLPRVRTDLLLFAEHDTPLTPDCEIPFDALAEAIRNGDVNLVRLHHEAHVHWAEHGHLHVDSEPSELAGVPMVRTMQWSQRPHLASVAFYRHLLAAYFAPDARTMIEDRMYGVLCEALDVDGAMSWALFRTAIFHPPGGNVKRSYHLDARGPEQPKWEETFTW